MIVACDIDGVLADIHQIWLDRYNVDYSDHLTVDRITEWDMSRFVKPECGKKIYDYLDDPSLYDEMPPIEGALEGVLELRRAGHRVVFVTSSVNGASGRKLRWLQDWGFFETRRKSEPDYVECTDKSLIRADVLIDDYHGNLAVFHGERIQFLQPWNANKSVDGAWIACNWREIPQIVENIQNEQEK